MNMYQITYRSAVDSALATVEIIEESLELAVLHFRRCCDNAIISVVFVRIAY